MKTFKTFLAETATERPAHWNDAGSWTSQGAIENHLGWCKADESDVEHYVDNHSLKTAHKYVNTHEWEQGLEKHRADELHRHADKYHASQKLTRDKHNAKVLRARNKKYPNPPRD